MPLTIRDALIALVLAISLALHAAQDAAIEDAIWQADVGVLDHGHEELGRNARALASTRIDVQDLAERIESLERASSLNEHLRTSVESLRRDVEYLESQVALHAH